MIKNTLVGSRTVLRTMPLAGAPADATGACVEVAA